MNNNGTLKSDVLSLLRHGKENARTGKSLARTLGFSEDREVRIAIRELIADRVPVAASSHGYYIATSSDEAIQYMKVLRSRLVNDAYRRRDFKLASRVILDPHQMTLL